MSPTSLPYRWKSWWKNRRRSRGLGAAVLHRDLADVDVLVEVDGVAHVQDEAEPTVGQGHVGHEGVGLVADLPLPLRTVDPGQPPVGEHPEAARMADGVVLLAEVREIDVAQPIVGVEHHLQRAVADDEVARHDSGLSSAAGRYRRPEWWDMVRPFIRRSAGLATLLAPRHRTPSLVGSLGSVHATER